MADKKQKKESEPRWGRWMLGTGLTVVLLLIGLACLQYWVVDNFVAKTENDVVTRFGISGDFFGFANSLFSALAFAMIIVTLWMQKYELGQQRKELDQTQEIMELQVKEMELQREEMQDQKQEMKDQNESLRRQTFENTFFGLLQMHGDVVTAIKPANDKPAGREAFSQLLATLRNHKAGNSPHTHRTVKIKGPKVSAELYEDWYANHEAHIGHYYRTLYNIVRYVNEYGGDQSRMYARLVRAQLSSNELQLLLYNGLSKYGKEKFKPLIEEYTLLKHLKKTEENEDARQQYAKSAFERPDKEEAA